ncbi:MAG TPA: MFS transporter [Chitinophagales bacterium]|nr:MFS transporter [Chitinophagales bacterium]HMU69141.1 MFS transporter [Chitinophagales bacterium]HMX03399.1 MFS transporter [Chitinophagales bacterium]HMZ88809.1 MFS transporter [Chitinophagales bacterium]HNA58774.1 MFS transporter [Chitinophagales bacterium]
MNNNQRRTTIFNLTVLVAALGYFVDIYDLQLFNLVSKTSLKGIGITDPSLVDYWDVRLFNVQMIGMLVGGIIWGIMGDLKGRKSILFGSILLYSAANILNGFVDNTTQYQVVRFFAGLGLAGELGAAITLVAEIMSKEHRGYGTMLIVSVGALGAVAAFFITSHVDWRVSYYIGGGLGLALLLLRFGTFESTMFDEVKQQNVARGQFLSLFSDRKRFLKYVYCILIGIPVWYCIGVLMKFSERFAKEWGIEMTPEEAIQVRRTAIMLSYIGLCVGDLLSGYLSQVFKSRKKIVMGYLIATVVLALVYLNMKSSSLTLFHIMCFLLGCATGYWALFVTIASEQFGTNIRATVTTTVPNFVRGLVVPLTLSFAGLSVSVGNIQSAMVVGAVSIGIAMIATLSIKETFGKDLNYMELS